MPRNKAAKRNASRHSNNALAITQKMEKEFIGIPAKLATHLQKEIASLKQKENKIKSALNKIKSQVKTWDAKIKASSKAKTSTAKKQLAAAKKAQSKLNKTQAMLTADLNATSKLIAEIAAKHAKFSSLSKVLSQFNKDWVKSAKKSKTTIKAKAKKSKSKPRSKIKQEQNIFSPAQNREQESMGESMNTITDQDVSFNETVEITS